MNNQDITKTILMEIIPILIGLGGILITFFIRRQEHLDESLDLKNLFSNIENRGASVLKWFALIVVIYATMLGILYWDIIKTIQDQLMLSFGLFISMVGGMFLQVISFNHKNKKDIFDVSAYQLLYPILFSVIVFYPIWIATKNSDSIYFSVYTAFLNGYFWESIVSSAKKTM